MKRNYALAVQLVSRGLRCDTPGCGYIDEAQEVEDEP